jgi:hypothetical protein
MAPLKTNRDLLEETSAAVSAAVVDLLMKHDGGAVAVSLLAEGAVIIAALRKAKIHDVPYIMELFGDVTTVALTYDAKSKIVFTDGNDTGVKQ